MEHFPIVLALVRAASRERNPAVLQHAERLREALEHKGAMDEARALQLVFDGAKKSQGGLSPSKVVLSRAMSYGDTITPSTNPPVDKETSTPLAEIWTIDRLAGLEPPVLDEKFEKAVAHLVLQWERADELQSAGVKVPRSTLLFGEPGTGKTRLALWTARTLGLPVVLARLDGLTSSFLGTTARNVRALFDFANRYRCLLLLDEFDGIAKVRDDPQELGEVKRVVNAVLQCIDSRAATGLTMAITNHEKLLDPAVWRRFDARLHIGMPDAHVRTAIVQRYMQPFPFSAGAAKVLAWMTGGMSGSEIETMCDGIKRHLTLYADKQPTILDALELFLDLSANSRPSVSREALKLGQKAWAQAALENNEISLNQTEIAEVMGSTQSRVSRMVKAAARA